MENQYSSCGLTPSKDTCNRTGLTPLKDASNRTVFQSAARPSYFDSSSTSSSRISCFDPSSTNTSILAGRSSVIIGGASNEAILQARVESLTKERDHIKDHRDDLMKQLHAKDEIEREKDHLIQSNAKLNDDIENFKIEIRNLRSISDAFELKTKGLTREHESKLAGAIAEIQRLVQVNNDHLAALEISRSDKSNQKQVFEEEIAKLNQTLQGQTGVWDKLMAQTTEFRKVEGLASTLRFERDSFSQQVLDLQRKNEILSMELETKMKEFVEMEIKYRILCDQKSALEASFRERESKFSVARGAWETERIGLESRNTELVHQMNAISDQLLTSKAEIVQLKDQNQQEDKLMGESSSSCTFDGLSESAMEQIEMLKQKLRESDSARRKLHNTLQELKGNIRVFVRCRPFLKGDGVEYHQTRADEESQAVVSTHGCVRCNPDGTSVTLMPGSRSDDKAGPSGGQIFAFDQVFKPQSTQAGVYEEVSQVVQSALDGYRVCIFSYGQTGSGKTHTMTGERRGAARGIIPRAVEQIITQAMSMREAGWSQLHISASMVEVYNEELRDLLIPAAGKASSAKLSILYQRDNGRVHVNGLTSVELDSTSVDDGMRQLDEIMDIYASNRTTSRTEMNEQSSRSHALFMLDIVGRHSDGVTVMQGGVRLCDLAGSERLDRTGTASHAVGRKETASINQSLTTLGIVFRSLANKDKFVNYRDSKLTMLLQDCLSGDGKSLMIVNVSPTVASSNETLCSLRFADDVSRVELGKARRNLITTAAQNILPPPPQPTLLTSSAQQSHADGASTSNRMTGATGGPVSTPSRMLPPSAPHQRGSRLPGGGGVGGGAASGMMAPSAPLHSSTLLTSTPGALGTGGVSGGNSLDTSFGEVSMTMADLPATGRAERVPSYYRDTKSRMSIMPAPAARSSAAASSNKRMSIMPSRPGRIGGMAGGVGGVSEYGMGAIEQDAKRRRMAGATGLVSRLPTSSTTTF